MQYVVRVYDGYPSAAALKADMALAADRKLPLIASYDPDGYAVTVDPPAQSGIQAMLFAALPLRGHSATLRGPDGKFFTPAEGGVRMRGSGFVCPDNVATFLLRDMEVANSSEADLDLMCRAFSPGGWLSIFVTRYASSPSADSVFAGYLGDAEGRAPQERRPQTDHRRRR